MSLFVKKQRQPASHGDDAARSRQAARPGAAPQGTMSDRDILAALAMRATQRARIEERGRAAGSEPGHGSDAGAGNVRLERTAVPENRQRPTDSTGNVYVTSRTSGEEAASGTVAKTDENAAGEFSFSPRRPSLVRRIARRLRALCFFILGLCVFVLTLAGVYKGSLFLYDWIQTSDTFVIRHIDITGNVRLSRDVILHLAGLREGSNTFSVSVADMERRLRGTPWVEDVAVQRILPDRFVIRVQERMPSFWVRVDNRLFYSNERGEPIAPVESNNFMSLPLLTVEPGCENDLPYLARIWKDLRAGALPVEPGAVATVDVNPSHGINLYFEDKEMRLSLSTDDWEGNLKRLAMTFADLTRRRELAKVQELRAADGRVWVVLRGPAAP